MTDELKPLSKKHQRVQDEYLICFNQTRAYMAVYPTVAYESAKTASARLFANDNFLAHLQARLDEVHMSVNEALKLQADIARADVGDIMEPTTFGYNFDMKKAKETGFTKLIKKVKQKTVTIMGKGENSEDTEIHTIEIELYDSQAAIRDALKVHGKFTERVEVDNKGQITLNVVYKDGKDGS